MPAAVRPLGNSGKVLLGRICKLCTTGEESDSLRFADPMVALKSSGFLALLSLSQSLCWAAPNVPTGVNHDNYDRLLKKYVDSNGLVGYENWKANTEDRKALTAYLEQFAAGANRASGNERYASLINSYNAFVLDWIVQNYPVESIWSLKDSFKAKCYKIGGEMVSLNDIENSTLRAEFGYHNTRFWSARPEVVHPCSVRPTLRVSWMSKLIVLIESGWGART